MSSKSTTLPLINGFSKFSRKQRIEILQQILNKGDDLTAFLDGWMHPGAEEQAAFEGFSENYITSYHLPFGVVPNMVINGRNYLVPMVTEESSVIAAASKSAKFWSGHGGFKAEIVGTERKGQIHFTWSGDTTWLTEYFPRLSSKMMEATKLTTRKMRLRGGGITGLKLVNKTAAVASYYQVDVSFETADAMGANFINTCLEEMAQVLLDNLGGFPEMGETEVVMSILSNYTPDSMVRCTVECDISELSRVSGKLTPQEFARKFELANRIAVADVSRAVTHNKGIFNGVDSVVLATGNDWRAVEACGHAWAASGGSYGALTETEITGDRFKYTLNLPLALGTVGGLTSTHPQAKLALSILGNPGAGELMMIAAAAGLANNFSAVSALITSGIQQGHMKMHLPNILIQLNATPDEEAAARNHFAGKPVSHAAVEMFIHQLRHPDAENQH
jgi:hydroxymethylglutaryl-CoA reductase